MLTFADLTGLPFTPDLVEGGIHYVQHVLAANGFASTPSAERLREMVGSTCVELALRRYLEEGQIPFAIAASKPVIDPDSYTVSLGGRRCVLVSRQVLLRKGVAPLQEHPELLLDLPAWIGDDGPERLAGGIWLFAFLLAYPPRPAQVVGNMLHTLGGEWARPKAWRALEALSLKSEAPGGLVVQIGGLDQRRRFCCETLELAPMQQVFAVNRYYSLAYVSMKQAPQGRLWIHSLAMGRPAILSRYGWKDISVDGAGIWLAGYAERDEVLRHLRTGAEGALKVSALHPLRDLMDVVREWEKIRKKG